MNCSSCGGALDLVAARGYFFCRYCGSFHFPEAAADQGVRILGESPRPMACAACKGRLSTALLDERHPVQYCRDCRGVLVARTTFAGVIQMRRAWATDPPAAPVPLDTRELARKVLCPSCQSAMATHPYYGPGNVVIDTCGTCDVVWLDFGELKQILDAPGRDRGRREAAPSLDDPPPTIPLTMSSGDPDAVDLFELLTRLF